MTPLSGPYINAELSAGGLPLWLTGGDYGRLRDNGTRYANACVDHQTAVNVVVPYQIHKNDTVISYYIERI